MDVNVTEKITLRIFDSPWFYWYTGNKIIAIVSIILSTLVMWLLLFKVMDFSIIGVIIAVLLDVNGFLLIFMYLIFLRNYIPEVPSYYPDYLHFREKSDLLVGGIFLKLVFFSFVVNRLSAFFVAKLFQKYQHN